MNKSETNAFSPSMNINVNHILTFLFIIIAIVGILGNLLVIISVEFDARMRRSLTNQLIVRVASCDFIILLFNIPDIIQFVLSNNGNWVLSQFSCKFIRTTLVLAQYASVLNMCALTIERFIGIVYPLRSKFLREEKHVLIITIFVWLFSLLCASPNLIYLHVSIYAESSRRSCRLQYNAENISKDKHTYIIHKSFESIVFYFFPLLLQIYCYIRIARQLFNIDETLQTSYCAISKSTNHRTKDYIDDEDYYTDNDDNSSTKYTTTDSLSRLSIRRSQNLLKSNNIYLSKVRLQTNCPLIRQPFQISCPIRRTKVTYNALKSRRNVIKMLFIVVLIYFISFSPQVLVFTLFETNMIETIPHFIQTPYFVAFTMLLVTISSASNPLVYAIFCSKFRQSFLKVLRKLFCCCQTKFTYPSNQRAVSLQQISTSNQRFNGRIHIDETRPTNTNANYQ
ncbi:unnamed protein product [Rotaria socialis]|uniref:G-protein coupled receptors family 1 profile domain-containing protein n=1 Tax=Rotaria socialis TaxID=392032 RepID=A0A817SAW0_9BILA|nr:unnamed protein product [Rotaria socialis]CAF4361145.1 unnamed protein product [Rotaria socialis]